MWHLLLADENLIFSVALAIMLILAVLEGGATLLGMGLSGLFEHLIPGLDLHTDAHLPDNSNALSRLLGWMKVGEVPLLVVLIVFLTCFGLIGIGLQAIALQLTGLLWPGWLMCLPSLLLTLPCTRALSSLVGKVMPRDETTAIRSDALVGRIAIITLGEARHGSPAEARTRDQFGQTHYVMVEPDEEDAVLRQGEEVLLIRQLGSRFRAIANPHPQLSASQGRP
ncbi:YqiJ family protein [Pokkaliibacter sp. MBI-7]|uniref:DUF1449 domain-containing protein n=1 Tax=Proteobacteria bacterium 228 TaxID=2083153 RepID=A0A2S5KKQ6_9PROT|nr:MULTISPECIES: YqiJ family protein [Pokkaliibacter]MDH2432332.1 YqiJ family protein [Pokkaliibacter sp. MBI-7]PPC75312.1 hypothetical protein C4K68_22020 [Pokkaliibacter plantistimulans]